MYQRKKVKTARIFGEPIFPNINVTEEKLQMPPGMHGAKRKRANRSEYGKQLLEKQKVRQIYGLKEKQFREYYHEANRKSEPTPSAMLSLLERRLDNVVFRTGLAVTRDMARQFISHGHIMVNGEIVTIPSYSVREGDVIRISEAGLRNKTLAAQKEELNSQEIPTWMEYNPKETSFTITSTPYADQESQNFDLTLVVQFYSR